MKRALTLLVLGTIISGIAAYSATGASSRATTPPAMTPPVAAR